MASVHISCSTSSAIWFIHSYSLFRGQLIKTYAKLSLPSAIDIFLKRLAKMPTPKEKTRALFPIPPLQCDPVQLPLQPFPIHSSGTSVNASTPLQHLLDILLLRSEVILNLHPLPHLSFQVLPILILDAPIPNPSHPR